ncbi:MAG: HNH endonuclease, partial [Shinella sp.]
MSDYKFSSIQRFVVFTVYGPETKCYLCSEPVTLKTMQVDHIIPEHLLGNATRLAEVVEELALPKSFSINSYENWLPSCGPCNNAKRNNVYRPGGMYLAILKRAEDNAEKCRSLELKWKTKARIDNALSYLEAAAENDELDFSQLGPLIVAFVDANPT